MMIAAYREPQTVADVAAMIRLFVLDTLGLQCAGGFDKNGTGHIDVELDAVTVRISVADQADVVRAE